MCFQQSREENDILDANPVKPPVLSKFEPGAKNELSTAASLKGAGACLRRDIAFFRGRMEKQV